MTKVRVVTRPVAVKTIDVLVLLVGCETALFEAERLSGAPAWLCDLAVGKGPSSFPETIPNVAWPDGPKHVVLLTANSEKYYNSAEALKTLAARACDLARQLQPSSLAFLLDTPAGAEAAPYVAEGALLGTYEFSRYKSSCEERGPFPRQIELLVAKERVHEVQSAISAVTTIVSAQNTARDLVNEPPTALGIDGFVSMAKDLSRQADIHCEIMRSATLARQGYGGILAVGRGAQEQPCLITLRYAPRKRSRLRLVLIGKAILFDTGGYCLKPAKDMWRMKGDMAGGAAVIAAMAAIAKVGVPVEVLGLIPCAKNLVSERAYLPGDVIRTRIGKTVHVGNTDAEGRLLLMDALIHAGRQQATHVVDIATLTGSVVRALGPAVSGIMGNDKAWVEDVIAAGQRVGEDFWELPLVEEYREYLKSHIADLDNVGSKPDAGAIVAALFLREFVPAGAKWAHLDIAGPFLVERPWKYYKAGATGFGVRTLVEIARSLQMSELSNSSLTSTGEF